MPVRVADVANDPSRVASCPDPAYNDNNDLIVKAYLSYLA